MAQSDRRLGNELLNALESIWNDVTGSSTDAGASSSTTVDATLGLDGAGAGLDHHDEVHVDVLGAHAEVGAQVSGDAHADVGANAVDAGYDADVDVLGVEVASSNNLHIGLDGVAASDSSLTQFGTDLFGGGISNSSDQDIEFGDGGVSAHASSTREAHADVLGATVQAGMRTETDGYVHIDDDGLDVGYTTETDVAGVDVTQSTTGHLGVDGAGAAATDHVTVGDENLSVGAGIGAGAGVDLSSGVDVGVTADGDAEADIRGAALGAHAGVGLDTGVTETSISEGGDVLLGVTVGGTDVDASVGAEVEVGLDGVWVGGDAGLSGVVDSSVDLGLGPGGLHVGGSLHLAALGGLGIDDAQGAWDNATDTVDDTLDEAGDAAGDAVDDVGDATGLW